MTSPFEIGLFVFGVVLPFILAMSFLFDRRRNCPVWVKVASVGICVGALGWWCLHLLLSDASKFHFSRETYYQLVGFRGILVGLILGFLICIQIAGYNKPRRGTSSKSDTPEDNDSRL